MKRSIYISLIKDLLLVSNSKILLKFQRKMLLKSKVWYKKIKALMQSLNSRKNQLFYMSRSLARTGQSNHCALVYFLLSVLGLLFWV